MTTNQCSQWAERLVDYADQNLAGDECRVVEVHLDQCQSCRELLGRLKMSLDLATVAWEGASRDANDDRSAVTRVRRERARNRRRVMFMVASTAVAISAAAVLLVVRARVPDGGPAERGKAPKQVASAVPKSKPANERVTDFDVDRLLRDHEQAARVSASIRIVTDIIANVDVERQSQSYLESYYLSKKQEQGITLDRTFGKGEH